MFPLRGEADAVCIMVAAKMPRVNLTDFALDRFWLRAQFQAERPGRSPSQKAFYGKANCEKESNLHIPCSRRSIRSSRRRLHRLEAGARRVEKGQGWAVEGRCF